MFKFFRNHQKLIFLVITGIIIVTFTFFGTYSTFDATSKKRKDEVVARGFSGKNIKRSEIDLFSYFLIQDEDICFRANSEGIITEEFFKTKIAEKIISPYKDIFIDLFNKKFNKIKNFQPYVHPSAAFLSCKNIWNQFNTNIDKVLEELQAANKFEEKHLAPYFTLYRKQQKFSPFVVKNIIDFQKTQYQWIPEDPNLTMQNLALFNYMSFIDWFGYEMVDLISQYILHISDIAQKEDILVTNDEVKFFLMEKAKNVLKHSKDLSDSQKFSFYLNALNLKEKMAVDLFKKIVLFKKYFEIKSSALLIDDLSLSEMNKYKNEKVSLAIFQPDRNLYTKNILDFLSLKLYLDSVTDFKTSNNIFFAKYLDIKDLLIKHPYLVEKKFSVEMKHINIEDLALNITEKELWNWQMKEGNFSFLKEKFPILALNSAYKSSFEILENLSNEKRYEIDRFSRIKMIEDNKDLLINTFEQIPYKKSELSLKYKSFKNTLNSINDRELILLLEKEDINKDFNEKSKLYFYTKNNKDFYRIKLLKKAESPNVISYVDAKAQNILIELLEEELKKRYEKLSGSVLKLFSDENNQKKSFYDVNEELAKYVYKEDLLKIDQRMKYFGFSEFSNDKYGQYFIYLNINEVREKLSKKEITENDLNNLFFQIQKREKDITKDSKDSRLKEAVFAKDAIKGYSYPHIRSNDRLFFYKILDKKLDEKNNLSEILKAKEILKNELLLKLNEKKVSKLFKNNKIKIPLKRVY